LIALLLKYWELNTSKDVHKANLWDISLEDEWNM
jgi:hypothetical protein